MTLDFIVVTVIGAPSTVSVTVLWEATAMPPANTSVNNSAPTSSRNAGERTSWILFKTLKSLLSPALDPCGPAEPAARLAARVL